MFDRILKRNNLSYSELTPEEKADLKEMRKAVKMETVDIGKIQESLESMIATVSNELTGVGENDWSFFYRGRRDEHLKARLKNYRLLHEVITRPDKMREHAMRQLQANLETDREGGGGGII